MFVDQCHSNGNDRFLDLHYRTKIFDTCENIQFDTPNFTAIDRILSNESTRRLQASIRSSTIWLERDVSANDTSSYTWTKLARFDSITNQFTLDSNVHSSYRIDGNNGQLTLTHESNEHCLTREISLHAQTGQTVNDDILRDTYRLVRLRSTTRKYIIERTSIYDKRTIETARLSCSTTIR
jgi:hypothetical protein